MMKKLCLVLALAVQGASAQESADKEGVEFFEKKIRPVLVERCYSCHSAGAKSVKASFVLDTREGLLKGGDTGPALLPGDPDKSPLIHAIRYTDEELKMPPKGRLSKEVVADFEAWVKRGAPDPRTGAAAPKKKGINIEEGRKYWAVRPLRNPPVPEVRDRAWVRTPVDAFILAKLEAEGIAPAGAVDRRRLIRRASFALLGLPPVPADVDAFEADAAPDAYGKLLDRLLASPHFGERWARHWLDVARFAESHGFEQDYDRENAWPYRDFVIQAFNRDLPYDQFVRWQVAGDELAPDDPLAWMATGFLGAGAFPTQLTEAEFESARYDELDSMASTVGSAMMALSVGCARCHDHKFDPIPTSDYYRLASTFTSAVRSHVDFDLEPEANRRALEAWEQAHAPLAAALAKFEREELPSRFERWAAARPWEQAPADAWTILDGIETRSHGGATFRPAGDGSVLATGTNPNTDKWTFTARTTLTGITAVRLEALHDPSLKKGGPGRADNGNFSLTDFRVTVRAGDGKGRGAPARLVSARATFEQNAGNLSAASAIDADKASGWAVDPQFGKTHAIVFEFEQPVGVPGGTTLVFDLEFNANSKHAIGRPRLSVSTRPRPVGLDGPARTQTVAELLETLRAGGSLDGPARAKALAAYGSIDPEGGVLHRAVQDHLAKKPAPKLTKIMVTTEGMKPLKHHAEDRGFPHFYKETHILARGDVNKKQGVATQSFLQILMGPEQEKRWVAPPPAGSRTPRRRAALAAWLTDVEHGAGALVARVIVNRLWAQHFGRGIVATPNDFGAQGDPPSHPELLDWLAGELIRNGWRLKPIQKLLMTSAVYLQGGATDPVKAKRDPENRLYGRREPRRLEAEAIRDTLLSVGGLLDARMYGPGSLDENMARRSVYFMVKRSKLIPMMMVFDAPEPLVSQGGRPTTTIAPQALLFMNSPLARRSAAALAKRVDPAAAVRDAYRLALGRVPREDEARAASEFLRGQKESYEKSGHADPRGAALADFCQALLCLNEFVYVE